MNTVAQQSRQAGIVMPQVAIYHAPDINAFATGARRDASLVAVSTGLLQNMSRDEAEAVIAHEISHIANGDMVTMTLIQGVVNTFVIFISRILAQIAAGFMGGNRDEGEESNGNPLIYFAVSMVLELVFGILASIITMWFSRHREFHADAGSAKLVGREKMIAALQRLKTSYEPWGIPEVTQQNTISRAGEHSARLFLCLNPGLGHPQAADDGREGGKHTGGEEGNMVAILACEVKHQGDQRRTGALPKETRGSQHAAGPSAAMSRR